MTSVIIILVVLFIVAYARGNDGTAIQHTVITENRDNLAALLCPPDGEWPAVPIGVIYKIVCPIPYFNFSDFLATLPTSVGEPTQEFLGALQKTRDSQTVITRKCGPDGLWGDIQGACAHSRSACWQRSYGRGVGVPPSTCKDGLEQSGLLCYPHCKPGYDGVGPVCWERCPAGYQDDGAICTKRGDVRPAENHCPWYDKCGVTFAKGCTKCPKGYSNAGCLCIGPPEVKAKDSYGRGVGHVLSCATGLEQNGLLCYPKCREHYKGVGPVCWKESCSGDYSHDCGILCTKDSATCKAIVEDILGDTVLLLLPYEKFTDWLEMLFGNPVLSLISLLVDLVLTKPC